MSSSWDPDAVLAAHAALVPVAWRVGSAEVPLASAVGLRGYPGLDPALPALAEALARSRVAPPQRPFVDATGGVGALIALARALGGPPGRLLVASAAALRAALGAGVEPSALEPGFPWDLPPGSVEEAWWRPASERGWSRVRAELDGWARALQPGGRLVAVWHKDEGGKRAERMAAERFEALQVVTRAAGWRVVELTRPRPDVPVPDPWCHWRGPDGPMQTLAGTFAAERVDAGTAALLTALERDALRGARVLDLGCGSGLLSLHALRAGAACVWALDDDLAAVRSSEAVVSGAPGAVVRWSDLTLDVPEVRAVDVVLTNPPFHVGRRVVGALSEGFVAAAATALRPQGRLWLVANAALPFERLLASWHDLRDVTPAKLPGYRVLTASRP